MGFEGFLNVAWRICFERLSNDDVSIVSTGIAIEGRLTSGSIAYIFLFVNISKQAAGFDEIFEGGESE